MKIKKNKLLYLIIIFLLGISCLTFSLYELLSTPYDLQSSDFITIKGTHCTALNFRKGSKQSESMSLNLCNYRLFNFTSTDPILIENKQEILDNVKNIDTLWCTISLKDYIFINRGDVTKYNLLELASGIEIYGLETSNQVFLSLNTDKLNSALNTNKRLGFYFFGTISILILVFGFRKLDQFKQ